MNFQEIFFQTLTLIGGLAFFLFGMNVMGDGLTKVSGGRLEQVLERLTDNRFKAVLLGAGVTAVIQSSSATTVTVVGFVNSGIMKLGQAVGIIMGANIGTTVTSWLLSLTGIESSNFFIRLLKPASFTPVLALAGIVLIMTARQEKRKDIGSILIGFSILMFGMETMSGAVEPLAEVPQFTNLLTMFSNPLLGMLAGALLTAVIQSSSASVGILQALCATGTVLYSAAIPIIMGQNIGTCVTALLSSVGAGKNAKRAALVHLYFNLIGTTVFMLVFYGLNQIVHFNFMSHAVNVAGIAVIHSLFNIGATILLFPFARYLEKLALLTVREDEEESVSEFARLDIRFLETPALALEQCKHSADEMAELVRQNISESLDNIFSAKQGKKKMIEQKEEKIDRYEEELTDYLHRISNHSLLPQNSDQLNMLLYCVRDLERISDHACNIVDEALKMTKSKVVWPKKMMTELENYREEVRAIVNMTVEAFVKEDGQQAHEIEQKENTIDRINKRTKKQTLKRVKKEKLSPEIGIFMNELAINFERVADHCENIAISLMGGTESDDGGADE